MKVLKFGGSSIANGNRMLNIAEILKKRQDEQIVLVLSACQNVTNLLENAASYVQHQNLNAALIIVEKIKQLHLQIADENIVNSSILKQTKSTINNLCNELGELMQGISFFNELTPQAMAKVYSFGEILSSRLFYAISLEMKLNGTWFDVREVMISDSTFLSAYPIEEKIKERANIILNKFKDYNLIITQGFIASDLLGRTTVLGRGGSDFSASLLGASLNAESIEIWSDVNGVLSADPHIVPNAISIPKMEYSEIKDLSFWGAKVLHHKTILPAINNNIPVKILNSLEPTAIGTTIIKNIDSDNKPEVHSLVAKKNCVLLHFEFEIALRHKIPEDFSNLINYLLSKDVNILNIICTNSTLQMIVENVNANLTKYLEKYNYTQQDNLTAICIVGHNLNCNNVFYSEIFSKIIEDKTIKDDEWKYVWQYSENTLLFLTSSKNIDEHLKNIHNALIVNQN